MDGKRENLMLLGLGSSHTNHTAASDANSTSQRGSFLAPELFEHDAQPSIRSDVFAAGVTLYRAFTGSYPYGKIASGEWSTHGEYASAKRYRPDVPEALDAALRRACALDPNERFDNAQEFADALETGMARKAAAKPAFMKLGLEILGIA